MITMKTKLDTLKDLDKIYEDHKKKHSNREMNDEELRKLLEL